LAIVAFVPNRDRTSTLISAAVIVWGIGIVLFVIAGSAWLLGTNHHQRYMPPDGSAANEPAAAGPNWAEVVTALATAALALASAIALVQVWIAVTQMREARRAKSALARAELTPRWDADAFRSVRTRVRDLAAGGPKEFSEIMLALRANGGSVYSELLTRADFFEDLGIQVKYHDIAFNIVDDSFGYVVVDYWSLWAPFVQEVRRELRAPEVYENFDSLAHRIATARRLSI
jgi:hypothetical protein